MTPLSAAPASYELTLVGGASWDVEFPLETVDGEDADLDGWTVEAEIAAIGVPNTAWTAAISGSSVRLTLTAAETLAFGWEVASFDVLLINGAGTIAAVPVAGTIRRIPPVTIPD